MAITAFPVVSVCIFVCKMPGEKKRIVVTGGTGLIGKGIEAIVNGGEKREDEEWIFLSSKDADLT